MSIEQYNRSEQVPEAKNHTKRDISLVAGFIVLSISILMNVEDSPKRKTIQEIRKKMEEEENTSEVQSKVKNQNIYDKPYPDIEDIQKHLAQLISIKLQFSDNKDVGSMDLEMEYAIQNVLEDNPQWVRKIWGRYRARIEEYAIMKKTPFKKVPPIIKIQCLNEELSKGWEKIASPEVLQKIKKPTL